MSDWRREKLDPVQVLKAMGLPHEHVTYDPRMRRGDYSIIRQTTHDGTLIFTEELFFNTLGPIAARESYWKPMEAEAYAAKELRYIVGPLKHSIVYGIVDIPAGRYPGMRERTRMPVRCVCIPAETVSGANDV